MSSKSRDQKLVNLAYIHILKDTASGSNAS
jgi:hypothetical protein